VFCFFKFSALFPNYESRFSRPTTMAHNQDIMNQIVCTLAASLLDTYATLCIYVIPQHLITRMRYTYILYLLALNALLASRSFLEYVASFLL